jgi:hypothetical protein
MTFPFGEYHIFPEMGGGEEGRLMTICARTGCPRLRRIPVLATVILWLLAADPAGALTGSDFLPLAVGNFWEYDESGASITFTVTGTENVGGTDTFVTLQTGGAESGSTENRTSDENGVRLFKAEGPTPQGFLIAEIVPALLELPATFELGDTFGSSGNVFAQLGTFPPQTIPYSSNDRIVGVDPVTVPFGTFDDAVLVDSTLDIGGTITSGQVWYVQDLGIVKQVVQGVGTLELVTTNVPEPGTFLLLAGGLVVLAGTRRSHR